MDKTLETSIKEGVVPVIDREVNKILGVKIPKISEDISDVLSKPIISSIKINYGATFKKAKKQFKKDYIETILESGSGNISEVARIIDVDRRSVHRIVAESKLDISKIRKETIRPEHYRIRDVNAALENVLREYKEVLHPKKLSAFYSKVPEISKDIVRMLPEKPMPLSKAIEEFEKDYLRHKLIENGFDVKKTSEKIKLRYETLLRKIKRYDLH